jgi:uncharacterized protein (TIGR00266 family)
MVYHNGGISLEGKMNANRGGLGGLVSAIGRSMVSGESFFITSVKGTSPNGMVAIAPAMPGMIRELRCGPEQWRINDKAFLACDGSVSYEIRTQKLGTALFGGTGGLFIMETKGNGTLLINSFGALIEKKLDGLEPLIVDNTHVVAWSSTLDYNIRVASGIFGFTTGEGLVNEFRGKGSVWIQTRNLSSFVGEVNPLLAKGSN